MSQKALQNAGRAFWDHYERPLQEADGANSGDKANAKAADGQEKAETERERAFREKKEKRQRESKGKDGGLLKMSEELKGKDLYELLEVEAGATSEDIKKSYRKLVLVHHPDKMSDPTDEQKQHFLHIQEAFEIVSDPDKRRRYESTLEFDDSIPTGFGRGKLANADFYETFSPVFKRNARWSARTCRVPELGDETTDIEAVKQFYEFWHSFESWRDPLAMADEEELHSLEQAECREEKRWMERENAKVAKRLAQAERDRVSDLVKAAERNDPRMIAYREQVKKEKEEEKARKAAAIQAEKDRKEAEARAKAEAEEAARQAEAERKAEEKKQRDEQKNLLKAARQRLRAFHKGAEAAVRRAVHAEQLQLVCLRLETEQLHAFCEELEASGMEDAVLVDLMHREILACGATPIEDITVDLTGASGKEANSGASTVSPDDSNEEGSSEGDLEPLLELTPEELEAERLRQEAEAEEERLRQEKKAEEARKKREQQRKEEEKRLAAQRKQEKKEREAMAKQKVKEAKKAEQDSKLAEEQRLRQQQQREEQRLRALQEEEERQQQHQEGLISRAFESDRLARLAILDAYDDGLLDTALTSTLLREGSDTPNLELRAALLRIAATLPPSAVSKVDAADPVRREAEEVCVDFGLACMCAVAGTGAALEEPRARLAGALSSALRPPRDVPELTKETKAAMKKTRTRVRSAILVLLKKLQAEVAPAVTQQTTDAAAAAKSVVDGTQLEATEAGVVFASLSSYDEIGEVSVGQSFIASGPCVDVEGYEMVPIRPAGTVEMRIMRVVAPPPAAKAKAKGAARAAKQAKAPQQAKAASSSSPAGPQLQGQLAEFVGFAALGASGFETAAESLRQTFLASFDPEAVIAVEASKAAASAPASAEVAEQAPAAAGSKSKKGKKDAPKKDEEDLDALLQEFGMTATGGKSKKSKGKQ